ncbi:hypothetical protein CHS0354_028021 [Potamilus streckersoni]|uniref:Ig-like domain-containing protein n=1 Tax=Potamilus streckersoni TaxID=2493646 RepID=A0AAE0VGK5_9BIVA|nr:hypothetical protein CHS0354_028021 [Potamilus streckersoni]
MIKMRWFRILFTLSSLAYSLGEELTIFPALKQYWVIKGSTLNLTCRHNGTPATQEHTLSFWKSNTQISSGSDVKVNIFAVPDTQDITRTIRTLVITKSDVQFSDGVPYKCILGQNMSNFKGEAQIEVRVLEFQSAEYNIAAENEKNLMPVGKKLILECNASGMNPSDTSFTVTTKWLKVSEGNKQFLENSTKYTIFTENRTLEILNPVREDAGEYRCVFVFNKEDKASYQEVYSQPFNVKAAPKIETHDKNKNLVQEDTLELRCTASGFPKPTITWKKDGQALNQTERIHPKEERLVIYNLGFDDKGEYQCIASHGEFNDTASATMLVRVKDKLAALWPFLGIVAEVIVLCIIIFIYEKKRSKQLESEEDAPDAQDNPGDNRAGVRRRN